MSNSLCEGERLFSQGKLEEARKVFWAAVEEYPGDAMAWNNLAVVAQAEGNLKAAENYLKQALEVSPDLWEARFNLAHLLINREQWAKACDELNKLLAVKPGDLPAIKLLADTYLKMGKPEESFKVLEASNDLGVMRGFIDSLWLGVKYYTLADHLSVRDRLEGLMAAVLKLIDGQGGRTRRFRLIGIDPETKDEVTLEGLSNFFYYKEDPSLTLVSGEQQKNLVLTISEHHDWLLFHELLRKEMQAEGGCLGDFTQTQKVFKGEPRLHKYKLEATLNYFRVNVGPCDCHVLRARMV